MNTEKVYILEDRGILYINGPDSEKFLQNLISNDIEKVNESKSCFASLLSPQGKFLFENHRSCCLMYNESNHEYQKL